MKKIVLLFIISLFSFGQAQTQLVFVYFKDKPNKAAFFANPTSELSQKSLDRRANLGIALNDQDAPIEPTYIQNIKNLGFTVDDYSKWLNGVAVNTTNTDILTLKNLPFVKSVESFIVHPKVPRMQNFNKFEGFTTDYNYGTSTEQTDQINLRQLHQNGFTGKNIAIAVIDTGFPMVDTGSAFAKIRSNNQIKGGFNFISKNSDIYNTTLYNHGSAVLGTIGGFIDGSFVGSAPDADFYLYCSEVYAVEIPEEQLYWIESAEEADRKGVDIITTSLGYSTFDDARYNLTYADMNGKTSFIARAAQIAVEKGIFVLAAAGNSGAQTWKYILSPADNEKVFTIGAVNSAGTSGTFSSFGPNSEGTIKPDASARGVATATVYNNSTISASGTSLATPLAAGGVACLLQALPKSFSRTEIANQLRMNASLAPNHTDQQGFGILNFGKTLENINKTFAGNITIYPNPFSDEIKILTFNKINSVELYDASGRLIKSLGNQTSYNFSYLQKGVYYLKITTENNFTYKEKLIKK